MRLPIFAAIFLVSLSSAVGATARRATLADYLLVKRVGGASFSYDEKRIAFKWDAGGRPDIWVKPVIGGQPRQITHVNGVIFSFEFSPTADQLVYEVDSGGDDAPRLYLTDSNGRAPDALFPEFPKNSRIGFVRWAPDGKSFLFITNLPDEDFVRIQEFDLATRRYRSLWKSSGRLSFSMASPNLKYLVLQETLSDVNSNLYSIEPGHTDAVLLTPHQGEANYNPTGFSSDSRTLFYTSTEDREFAALREIDLHGGKSRSVLVDQWDVERGEVSAGGRYFFTVTNAGGSPSVVIREARSGKPLHLRAPDTGSFVPVSFSRSDRYLFATRVAETAPESLYVFDLRSGAAEQVVPVMPDAAFPPMAPGRTVEIKSFDGVAVPAILYQPPGAGPFPAIIEVHGGPLAQSRRTYSGIRQYLVAKGCAVLVPNVRGSTGYGKRYAALDDMDLGGAPLKDVIAAKQWLISNANVDPDRVAIVGASYGGYMALAAAAFTPREFVAHVDFFGISDFRSLLASYPAYWAAYSSATYKKYGDPKNPAHAAYQHDRSPANFADRIERPLLVVQGENDHVVPKEQSESIVEKLKTRQVPVEYLLIPGEGHGFSTNESRIQAYEAMDRFLDRFLAEAGAPFSGVHQ
jgi:dipeptidyl aminopeptidase/acylaminoacyl peptidase